jgi:hypothetical protein
MTATSSRVAAYATIGLGVSQALMPRQAGQVFGLGTISDDTTLWLGRLLGVANSGLGAAALNPELRVAMRPYTLGMLGANAAVTAAAGATGKIPARTALSVLAFVAAVVPGVLAD